FWRRLDTTVDAERAFTALYADQPHSFWFDSQSTREGLSRFSFIGCADAGTSVVGDLATLEKQLEETTVIERDERLPFEFRGGFVGSVDAWIRVERFVVFDHLARQTWLVALAAPDDTAEVLSWIGATAERLVSLHDC